MRPYFWKYGCGRKKPATVCKYVLAKYGNTVGKETAAPQRLLSFFIKYGRPRKLSLAKLHWGLIRICRILYTPREKYGQ